MYIFKIIDKDTGKVMHEEEAKAIVYGYSTDKAVISGSCTKATALEIAGAINAAREAGHKLMSEHPSVACFSGMIRDMKTAERASERASEEAATASDQERVPSFGAHLLQHFLFGKGEAK